MNTAYTLKLLLVGFCFLYASAYASALVGCAGVVPAAIKPAETPQARLPVVPPPAILEVEGTSQQAGIGSYCWSESLGEEEGVGICADMLGIPTAPEPLVVQSPVAAKLHLPVAEKPSHLRVVVFPVVPDEALDSRVRGYLWWDEKSGGEIEAVLQSDQEILLSLAGGWHVLMVSAWWDGLGDVVYGFLLSAGQKQEHQMVPFTELVSTPVRYQGQTVCTEGVALQGFEASSLGASTYARDGQLYLTEPVIWLEGVPVEDNEHCTRTQGYSFCPTKICGKFEAEGGYGHLGGFLYQITGTD